MAGPTNGAPVIIKRKKIIAGGGHHGGAWKVAYADFVTAMMAFFMLMWLLNATTEKQRKGIADYFNPTIPVNRISGGGDGALGGDSVMAENVMAQNGIGASATFTSAERQARGDSNSAEAARAEDRALAEMQNQIDKALLARSGESMTMERLLRHVVTRVSDEGLVIELFDLPDAPLFLGDSAQPGPTLQALVPVLSDTMRLASNRVAVSGHVRAHPVPLRRNPVWSLTTARAESVRALLEATGLDPTRIARISGHGDRNPVAPDPTALRNNRMEVILLRRDR